MRALGIGERRRPRYPRLVMFCPAFFACGLRNLRATMTELSERGARFTMPATNADVDVQPGQNLALTIRTPYGPSAPTAVVKWAEKYGDWYEWGVEFLSIPQDKYDPIRSLMVSAF